ncbi:MAG: hypothetical protein R2748_25825 [Bryobacterales bacterium]
MVLATVVPETEAHFLQPLRRHGLPQPLAIFSEEQQNPPRRLEPISFPPMAAVRSAGFIPAVDAGVRHPLAALALVQPVLVHELAKPVDVAALERVLDA